MSDDYTAGTYSKLAEVAEKKQPSAMPAPSTQPRSQEVNSEAKVSTTRPSNHDTVTPRHHETVTDDDVAELIRKAVKQFGKEGATYRFTSDEKRALAEVVYELKKKGIRSSENELTRIAINYLIWEYRHNKHSSILSRVIERLNS